MRVLIFSVSAGGGHGHAADALSKYICSYEPDSQIKIIDTFKAINPILDKVIIGSYLKTIKVSPAIFGKLYTFSEDEDGFATTISTKFNELMAFRLHVMIEEFTPDIIICTHPFPAEMVSFLKIKNQTSIPFITILTDYAPHSTWLHPGIDEYIVSNYDMKLEMVARGIKSEIIHDLGIPVKPDFIKSFDKAETFKELGFSMDKQTVLIMGGSLGMGKISKVYEQLSNIPLDIQIIIITGSNKKLYNELQELKEKSSKTTKLIGYTTEVNKYMQAADLLLSKPGGLTVTEALISKLPIGVFSPIPGQEEQNTEFLIRHNLAINLGTGDKISKTVYNLLSCPNVLSSMKNNCENFSKPNCGNDIYHLLSNLLHKSKSENLI